MYTGTMHALQGLIYSVMEKNMTKKWKKKFNILDSNPSAKNISVNKM